MCTHLLHTCADTHFSETEFTYMEMNTHLTHTSYKSHVNLSECVQQPDPRDSVCVQAEPNDVDSSLGAVLRLARCFSMLDDWSLFVGLGVDVMRSRDWIWFAQTMALMVCNYS